MLRSPYSSRSGRFPHSPFDFGPPIRFLVGPSGQAFDVHREKLSGWSPAFTTKANAAGFDVRNVYNVVRLPEVSVDDFTTLCVWLYKGEKPNPTKEGELLGLMRLWIAANKLGLWRWMNTILRLGMSLMQPREFTVEIETVAWVYERTGEGSKLRSFIVAIFCQRGRPEAHFFDARYEGLGIMRDAARFLYNFVPPPIPDGATLSDWKGEVNHGYRWGRDKKGFPVFVSSTSSADLKNDQTEVEGDGALPDYLVWNKQGETLPDEFFVTAEEGLLGAAEVARQLEWREWREGAKGGGGLE